MGWQTTGNLFHAILSHPSQRCHRDENNGKQKTPVQGISFRGHPTLGFYINPATNTKPWGGCGVTLKMHGRVAFGELLRGTKTIGRFSQLFQRYATI